MSDRTPGTEWWRVASCATVDPALFFPEHGGGRVLAREICARCAVQPECLDDAISAPLSDDNGIRAGHNVKELRQLRKEQPTKAAVEGAR